MLLKIIQVKSKLGRKVPKEEEEKKEQVEPAPEEPLPTAREHKEKTL